MKPFLLLLTASALLFACRPVDPLFPGPDDRCEFVPGPLPPDGFTLTEVSQIDFNGSFQQLQFVNDQLGFALGTRNTGGYAAVWKTEDGGITWRELSLGMEHYPRSFLMLDDQVGMITVHDIQGCPENCQNRCVILKTTDGGENWAEIVYPTLKGTLYHPQMDQAGNLYALLSYENQNVLLKSADQAASWDTLFAAQPIAFSHVEYSFRLFEDRLYVPLAQGRMALLDLSGTLLQTLNLPSLIAEIQVLDPQTILLLNFSQISRSEDGGNTWETIHEGNGRLIGHSSAAEGLFVLSQGYCPTDVFISKDVLGYTGDGGQTWQTGEQLANLSLSYAGSQALADGSYLVLLDRKLYQFRQD